MLDLPRLMPALITPFTSSGDVDWDAHSSNLAVLTSRGVKGVVIGGSNGEGPFLDAEEQAQLVKESRASGAIVIGIWGESVRQCLASIEVCQDADAALIATPTTLARTDTAAQTRFFATIAEHSPLPVLLYSVPRNTGYALDESVVATLAQHDNIVGMKDSGGDAVRLERMLGTAPPDFALFNGATASSRLAMLAGAVGAITASVNYLTTAMQSLLGSEWSAEEAVLLQRRLTRTSAAVERFGVPGVKVASRLAGLDPGFPRAPLAALHQSDELVVRTALESF